MSANSQMHTTLWVFEINKYYLFHRRDHKESESNNKQSVARRAKNRREMTSSVFESYLSLFLLCAQHIHIVCYCRDDAVKDERSEVNHIASKIPVVSYSISTSYHNKAICRRSMYLRPRFGEGIFVVYILMCTLFLQYWILLTWSDWDVLRSIWRRVVLNEEARNFCFSPLRL